MAIAATTANGGSFQTTSSTKPTAAMAKSCEPVTALVQTGLYSAAARMPTTAALVPRIAACAAGRRRNASQNGSAPAIKSIPGRKIAISAITDPTIPFGDGPITAPR